MKLCKPSRSQAQQLILLLAFTLLSLSSRAATHSFVHTDGPRLVDGEGHPLNLRGTSLGNWMVPEGYMFRLEKGPQSGREIDALINRADRPGRRRQILA